MPLTLDLSPGAGHPPDSDYQEVEEGATSSRQGRAVMPATVHPEILVVVDNAFYKGMGRNMVAIKRYLTSYFNAVNMRFATVRDNGASSPLMPATTWPQVPKEFLS
jgi:hypothetical protein